MPPDGFQDLSAADLVAAAAAHGTDRFKRNEIQGPRGAGSRRKMEHSITTDASRPSGAGTDPRPSRDLRAAVNQGQAPQRTVRHFVTLLVWLRQRPRPRFNWQLGGGRMFHVFAIAT